MDALLLFIIIFGFVIMLAISVYLLIVYVHPDDKGWGTAVYCKILVVLGLVLLWSQPLLLPLDVANNQIYPNSGGINMKLLWYIVYIMILIMVTILLPFAMLFYNTDDDQPFFRRFLVTLCLLGVILAIILVILIVSWIFLKYANIPVAVSTPIDQHIDLSANADNMPTITQNNPKATITVTASFVVYSMAMLSFIGWILLILFGGVGMFGLPIDWINAWRNRPRPRHSGEMRQTKEALIRTIERLNTQCQELLKKEQLMLNAERVSPNIPQNVRNRSDFQGIMSEFRAKFITIEEEFETFQLEMQYANSNPIVPWLKLTVGILFVITAILWILQIIFGYLVTKNDRPLIPFLNEMLVWMQNSRVGFFATIIYSYFILYLVCAVIKGNIKFGIRIPFIVRFYPMKPHRTWMNSFIFNIIMLLLAAAGIMQLATNCFPTYARNTAIYNMFGLQVNYMRFYTIFYRYKIFGIAFVAWSILSLFYMLFTCNRLPKYAQEIEAIRRKHTHNADFRSMTEEMPMTQQKLRKH